MTKTLIVYGANAAVDDVVADVDLDVDVNVSGEHRNCIVASVV